MNVTNEKLEKIITDLIDLREWADADVAAFDGQTDWNTAALRRQAFRRATDIRTALLTLQRVEGR
jgi:hypothetical protein